MEYWSRRYSIGRVDTCSATVLLYSAIILCGLVGDASTFIDWDKDIVKLNSQSTEEANAELNSPLHRLFGQSLTESRTGKALFRSYDDMAKIVGTLIDVNQDDFVHHNYVAMTAWMRRYALQYPNIVYMYSIGKSVEGRQLYVVAISDQPSVHETAEPEFKYVGNMHGNEVSQWHCPSGAHTAAGTAVVYRAD